MIADQGNVQTFAGSADARLYYLDLDGKEKKYLLEGEVNVEGGAMTPEEIKDAIKDEYATIDYVNKEISGINIPEPIQYTAGNGIKLTDNQFSVNTDIIATKQYVDGQIIQPIEYMAGEGINIVNNYIEVDSEKYVAWTAFNGEKQYIYDDIDEKIKTFDNFSFLTFTEGKTTIDLEQDAVFRLELESEGMVIDFDKTNLDPDKTITRELWITMGNNIYNFRINDVTWIEEPVFDQTNTVYVIALRWTGNQILANLAYSYSSIAPGSLLTITGAKEPESLNGQYTLVDPTMQGTQRVWINNDTNYAIAWNLNGSGNQWFIGMVYDIEPDEQYMIGTVASALGEVNDPNPWTNGNGSDLAGNTIICDLA
jgi:hypothetical protein